jgi:RND family efflux transporter MFP subunit
MKKIFRFLLPILILAIGFGGFIFMKKTKPKSEAIKIEEQVWLVTVTNVMPMTLSPTLTLYGRVESPSTATLRAPTQSVNINAKVKQVFVFEGENVNKGQVLIRLEDNENLLNLKQREADIIEIEAQIDLEKQRHASNLSALAHEEALLSLTHKSMARLRQLKRQRVSSQATLEEAQQAVERQQLSLINRRLEVKNYKARLAQLRARHTRAVAQRDLARLELARTTIKAPFAGVIAKMTVAVGDRVRGGDPLLSIYDNTTLEVRAQIPSRFSGVVLDALRAKHQVQAHTDVNQKPVSVELDRVSGQINLDSGGIDGLFRVKKGNDLLRLGQFLTLHLRLPEQSRVVALPFEAVYGTNRIYKLIEGRMKGITVERVGEIVPKTGESQILIRSPSLQPGEKIILTQLPNAIDGLKVRAR